MEDAGMSTAIFIRSYAPDFQWLSYSLRSIQKFATGFCDILIAVPQQDVPKLSHLTVEKVVGVHDGQPGYLCQQNDKLHADMHTRADLVVNLDSDTLFTRPVTPATFMRNGKPLWLITPWHTFLGDEKKAWFHVLAKALQECPPFEFMRKNTITIPRWAYGAFREHMQKLHGITLTEYIMSQPAREFSEFNTIGFYLWLYHRDKIHWHDTSIDGVPESVEHQRWSWSGLTPEIRAEIERELA